MREDAAPAVDAVAAAAVATGTTPEWAAGFHVRLRLKRTCIAFHRMRHLDCIASRSLLARAVHEGVEFPT